MKNKLVLIVMILLSLMAISGTAFAGATRTEFTAWDIPTSGFSEGKTWMDDGILYMRDMQYTTMFVQVTPDEDLQLAGNYSAVLNANIDLVTGCGHVWGQGENANWEGRFQGELCFDESLNPVSFATKGVMQAKGELKGLLMRYSNINGWMTGTVLDTSRD